MTVSLPGLLDTRALMVYAWGNNPRRAELKGRACKVIVNGQRMNSCLVEFESGERVVVSRRSLRAVEQELALFGRLAP